MKIPFSASAVSKFLDPQQSTALGSANLFSSSWNNRVMQYFNGIPYFA